MKIDCYLSEHCGSYHQLRENIDRALRELDLRAEVAYHTIYYEDAVRMGITGSPTIRVNGKDLFAGAGTPGIT
jgi:protein-disulfide isomerase